jgi:outer membrane protein assembly factor BamB
MKINLLFLLLLLASQAYSQLMMVPPGPMLPVDITEKPRLLWKYKVSGPVTGSPVIDGGTVYVGSLDSSLYALDLFSGKIKWSLSTGGAIRSSVCIVEKSLFLLSSDGRLYNMEKDSGRVYGFFQTMNGAMADRQHDYADYFTSTPVIEDSTIYFGSGENIYAISINSGHLQWTYKTGDLVHTRPVIDRGRLYAGSFDGNLYAIDIKTGNLTWKFKSTGNYSFPKGEVMGNPVVAAGMVFAGARDFNLYAIDVRGGFCNWMKQFPLGWALPVTANDSVIYVGTSDDRTIYALNIRSGKEVWKTEAGFNVFGGCSFGTTMGYFGTLAGKVHGIDLTTGKIKWTIELDSYKANHLTWLKPDDTYRDDIGKLIKTPLDMLKMYEQLGGIFTTPAAEGDIFVVAGYDGWIYCFSGSPK